MVGRLYRLGAKLAKVRAAESLERLGLVEAADRPVKTYSGGMRRRLDLGASLVGKPRMLILDEPTTGLDPRTRLDMWAFIRDLVAGGTTVLLTTQYLEEADQLADHSVVIDRGQVIASGTSAELKARLGSDLIEIEVRAAELDRATAALTGIARTPQLLVFATIQPVMFVLLFRYVFGGAIHVPGISYVDFLIPGIIVQTVIFGATSTSVGPVQ